MAADPSSNAVSPSPPLPYPAGKDITLGRLTVTAGQPRPDDQRGPGWTGYGGFEPRFVPAAGGWRIDAAVVEGDGSTYRRGNDAYESSQLVWVIALVLLGHADEDLWRAMQDHR